MKITQAKEIQIITAGMQKNVRLFWHAPKDRIAEIRFFKAVISEMLAFLPSGHWHLNKVIRMLTLYFLFETVKSGKDISGEGWEEERATKDLLQSCPWFGFDNKKSFCWLVQLTGKFTGQDGKDFLEVVENLPEYFNDTPIYSIAMQ